MVSKGPSGEQTNGIENWWSDPRAFYIIITEDNITVSDGL